MLIEVCDSVLRRLAYYMAGIGTAVLVLDALFSFLLTGTLSQLSASNSTYGVEQLLGWLGYFVQTLLSPAAAGLLYALSLSMVLTARFIRRHKGGWSLNDTGEE